MSTRNDGGRRLRRSARGPADGDPAEAVALVSAARRELLLRTHRHRLRRQELEDCFSQATLELVVQAREGRRFESQRHIANALEQRFMSRVQDRRRALAGRSPAEAALAAAAPIDGGGEQFQLPDTRAELERLVILRHELRLLEQLARQLSDDQRLVIAWQLRERSRAEFCERFGWSAEKYRKVAQRGRARLRMLMALEEGDPVPEAAAGRSWEPGTRP